jgi:hypothetical protein
MQRNIDEVKEVLNKYIDKFVYNFKIKPIFS